MQFEIFKAGGGDIHNIPRSSASLTAKLSTLAVIVLVVVSLAGGALGQWPLDTAFQGLAIAMTVLALGSAIARRAMRASQLQCAALAIAAVGTLIAAFASGLLAITGVAVMAVGYFALARIERRGAQYE